MDETKYRLCYVEGSFAYFTTQDLKHQWGDDWDDSPYEHNAGSPYEPAHKSVLDRKTGLWIKDDSDFNTDGSPKWEIIKVAFDGPFETPCSYTINSRYSVEDINAGAVAWLSSPYSTTKIYIQAGTTLDQFKKLIAKGGGNVYQKVNSGKSP